MVLEAFAALSLTASIVQFIDFGGKLFWTVKQLRSSKDGAFKDHADIEAATRNLKQLVQSLGSSTIPITATDYVSDDEQLLVSLAKDCARLADDFINLLEKAKSKGRNSNWKCILQAIQIVWNDKQINLAKDKLRQFESIMTLSMLKILKDSQSNVIKQLAELSDHLAERNNEMRGLLAMKTSLTQNLDHIKSSLNGIRNNVDETSLKLGAVESTLWKWATKGNRLSTEHHILKSLRFKSMKVRHAQIPEAHRKTFEWAYTSRTTPDHSCMQFKFAEWLRSGNGVYWIAGKAGSGKSTLVKFLYDSPRTVSELSQWGGVKDVVTASFFFWNSGTEMQRSVDGLLQSLLFEILRKCPSLIPVAAPTRWNENSSYHSESTLWSQSELKDAFRRIQNQAAIPEKFALFIDGLDEYEGDHSEVIDILHGLAKSEDVKVCVSSRPWNIFQETFGQNHDYRLFLEELTRPDIELFVRDSLESNAHFLSLSEMDTRYPQLVEEIVQKADGVFLWVVLIVRSLLQGLRDCDRMSELQQRIRSLPSRLEDYFKHILTTTDETYRVCAAETFEVALQASQPLSLMTYSYLDEENPQFAINMSIKSLSYREVLYRLRTMKRRLNARCNGLLEVTHFDEDRKKREIFRRTIDDFWSKSDKSDDTEAAELFAVYKVEFLHRTVRDFLRTKDIQHLIETRMTDEFQPLSVICRAIVAQIKALPLRDRICSHHFGELMENLLHYARTSDVRTQEPETETIDELDRTLCILKHVWQIEGISESLAGDLAMQDLQVSFFGYMARNGLCGYIFRKLLTTKRTLPSTKRLLKYALQPAHSVKDGLTYYPSMVRLLLDTSKDERTPTWISAELPSLWADFLVSIPHIWNHQSKDVRSSQLQIAQMLLDIGADPNQMRDEVVLWAETFRKIQPSKQNGKANLNLAEEAKMADQFSTMFLARNVDPSLITRPARQLVTDNGLVIEYWVSLRDEGVQRSHALDTSSFAASCGVCQK